MYKNLPNNQGCPFKHHFFKKYLLLKTNSSWEWFFYWNKSITFETKKDGFNTRGME